MPDTDIIVVLTTTDNEETAAEISRHLVEEELCACVNIIPRIRSLYRWEGKTCDDAETLMVVKTRAALFEHLRERVVSLHPYEVPEVIALPVTAGHAPYLEWVEEMTTAPTGG